MEKLHTLIANIYLFYQINKKDNTITSDSTLENCLFGEATLTKNVNIDRYGTLVMEMDLIEKEVFHFQVVDIAKMY